jgi:hypothetical protein
MPPRRNLNAELATPAVRPPGSGQHVSVSVSVAELGALTEA